MKRGGQTDWPSHQLKDTIMHLLSFRLRSTQITVTREAKAHCNSSLAQALASGHSPPHIGISYSAVAGPAGEQQGETDRCA